MFNSLSHNRDDHTKNFAFLMGDRGMWNVAPSYDLTLSSGPLLCGNGCLGITDVLKLNKMVNIKQEKALKIIDDYDFDSGSGLGDIRAGLISKSINKIIITQY